MRLADEDVTGQLISDPEYRSGWLELVRELQKASMPGGAMYGWAFHGTDDASAESIIRTGLKPSFSITLNEAGEWEEDVGVHFGTANVAAFFAEDRIESLDDSGIKLSLIGARLADLEHCGRLEADGQMIDCPIYTRLQRSELEVNEALTQPAMSWNTCFELLETFVVRGAVPPDKLVEFKSVEDVRRYLEPAAPRRSARP